MGGAYASSFPGWIDALVAGMRAVPGYRDPAASTTGIPVLDGPEIGFFQEDLTTYLVIGWSGDPDDPESPGNTAQIQAVAGPNRKRDETGVLTCRAVAQSGDASIAGRSVQAARNSAFAIVSDVETYARNYPSLGLTGNQVQLAQLTATRTEQWDSEGACCAVTFDISFLARI